MMIDNINHYFVVDQKKIILCYTSEFHNKSSIWTNISFHDYTNQHKVSLLLPHLIFIEEKFKSLKSVKMPWW